MSVNIRFPNITAASEAEQINQIKSYLHQLVEQLNWALGVLETGSGSANASGTELDNGAISEEAFYELKSLLLQATDNLNAYYDKINTKLQNQYVAQSAFDAHKQEVNQQFDDLGNQYVAQKDHDDYKQEVVQQFDDLENQYVSQTDFDDYKQEMSALVGDPENPKVAQSDFDAYKQEVTQQFDDFGNQHVSQKDFDDYKQEMSGLDDKYVSQTEFDEYKQGVSKTISDLQQIVEDLQQMIETN